jgi:hypothetical protein
MLHSDDADMPALEYIATAIAINDNKAIKAVMEGLKAATGFVRARGPKEKDWGTIVDWYRQTRADLAAFQLAWRDCHNNKSRQEVWERLADAPIAKRIASAIDGDGNSLRDQLIAGEVTTSDDLALELTARENAVSPETIKRRLSATD